MKKDRIIRLTQLGLLSAIVWIMAFTPLGYLKTAGVEITFMMIPVCIGAILLGPVGGAVLGLEFGITSLIQAFGMSAFGAALMSVQPVFTALVCIIPRILAGWLPGLLYRTLKRSDRLRTPVPHIASALVGALSNTVFFMTLLVLFFWNSEYLITFQAQLGTSNILLFVLLFVGVNGLVEILTAAIIAPAIAVAVERTLPHLH